jgi:hypothetical protein
MLLKRPHPTEEWTPPPIPALRSLLEGHFLVAELQADKLIGEWSVEKHRDYDGDLSIIILPEEDAAAATFCIHRDRTGIHLKASRCDRMETLGTFDSVTDAMQCVAQCTCPMQGGSFDRSRTGKRR